MKNQPEAGENLVKEFSPNLSFGKKKGQYRLCDLPYYSE